MLSIGAAAACLLAATSIDAAPNRDAAEFLQTQTQARAPIIPAVAADPRMAGPGWLDRFDRRGVEKRNPLAPITWAFYAGPAFPGPRGEKRPRLSAKALFTLSLLVAVNAVILGICLAALTRAAPFAEYFPALAALSVAASIGVSLFAVRRAGRSRRKKAARPPIAWPSGFSSS